MASALRGVITQRIEAGNRDLGAVGSFISQIPKLRASMQIFGGIRNFVESQDVFVIDSNQCIHRVKSRFKAVLVPPQQPKPIDISSITDVLSGRANKHLWSIETKREILTQQLRRLGVSNDIREATSICCNENSKKCDLKVLVSAMKIKLGANINFRCLLYYLQVFPEFFAVETSENDGKMIHFISIVCSQLKVNPTVELKSERSQTAEVKSARSQTTEVKSARSQTTLKELLIEDQGEMTVTVARKDSSSVLPTCLQDKFAELFQTRNQHFDYTKSKVNMVNSMNRSLCLETSLLGQLICSSAETIVDDSSVYLNVGEPFCMIVVGVQGGGKSHTVNVVLENCMIPCSIPQNNPLIGLHTPMSALVFHYDQSETNVCEATGLVNLRHAVSRVLGTYNLRPQLQRVVILVSPTFYKQRKLFYGDKKEEEGKYVLLPLLFRWATLDAVQLKKLMRIDEGDNQLYMGVMLAKIREYQRAGTVPEFRTFCSEILKAFPSSNQNGPLEQRLALLRQFVEESEENDELREEQRDLGDLVTEGSLVVADMTDPMLSPAEANGVFQVLLEQFRLKKLDCGKIVVFDEAHKYFGEKSKGGDGLASSIIDTVRLMRHEGMRVVVSTQSPLTMPPELLELSTVAVCHSFHSKDWYRYLSMKIPLPEDGFDCVQKLQPGEALTFASRPALGVDTNKINITGATFMIRVRPRITEDRGQSKCNIRKVCTLNHFDERKDKRVDTEHKSMELDLAKERIDVEIKFKEEGIALIENKEEPQEIDLNKTPELENEQTQDKEDINRTRERQHNMIVRSELCSDNQYSMDKEHSSVHRVNASELLDLRFSNLSPPLSYGKSEAHDGSVLSPPDECLWNNPNRIENIRAMTNKFNHERFMPHIANRMKLSSSNITSNNITQFGSNGDSSFNETILSLKKFEILPTSDKGRIKNEYFLNLQQKPDESKALPQPYIQSNLPDPPE